MRDRTGKWSFRRRAADAPCYPTEIEFAPQRRDFLRWLGAAGVGLGALLAVPGAACDALEQVEPVGEASEGRTPPPPRPPEKKPPRPPRPMLGARQPPSSAIDGDED